MKSLFIVFFLIPLFTIPVFGQNYVNVDELYKKAFALIKEGEFEDSISILNQILEVEPNNISALNSRANAQIGLEKFDKAIEDLDRIFDLVQEPSGGILYNYAVALSGIEEHEEAVQYFELIDEDDFNYFNAQNGKGVALLNLSRFEEAVKSFDVVIGNDPDNFTAHLFRGVSLSNMGMYDEALESINTALSIDSQNERANHALQATLNQKGLSLLADSKPEEAKIYFEKALANNPQDPNAAAYLNMAQTEIDFNKISNTVNSVYFLWAITLGGIGFSIFVYLKPRKQKQK